MTNLVPFPGIHFLVSSFSPFETPAGHNTRDVTLKDMTFSALDPRFMMVKCDPGKGKYLAINMIYRGDVVPKDVNATIDDLKMRKIIQFVDWSPNGFKCGINYHPLGCVPGGVFCYKKLKAVYMIGNSTAISDFLKRIVGKFDRMFPAFVHWYVLEGMEEGDVQEARETMAALEEDYKEEVETNEEM